MGHANESVADRNVGRASAKLAEELRRNIASGRFAGGLFLPSQRELARKHGLAQNTVRRALKKLEAHGLVSAQRGKGYRVLARAGEPDRGLPVAYVAHTPASDELFWDTFHHTLLTEFRKVAAARQWSLLVLDSDAGTPADLARQIVSAGACGAILETFEPALLRELTAAGVPAVGVDVWGMGAGLDLVNQDGFLGGLLAATCAAERGHRRIAMVGPAPMENEFQIVERFGGTAAGLQRAGLDLPPDLRVHVSLDDPPGIRAKAKELLSLPDRPTAVLSLWQAVTPEVVAAARELGLKLGRDLDLVGWENQEHYRSRFLPMFGDGYVPPAILWSIRDMAAVAVACLKQRRADPKMPFVHVRIPTRLQAGTPLPA